MDCQLHRDPLYFSLVPLIFQAAFPECFFREIFAVCQKCHIYNISTITQSQSGPRWSHPCAYGGAPELLKAFGWTAQPPTQHKTATPTPAQQFTLRQSSQATTSHASSRCGAPLRLPSGPQLRYHLLPVPHQYHLAEHHPEPQGGRYRDPIRVRPHVASLVYGS